MLEVAIGVVVIMAALAIFAYHSFSPQFAEKKAVAGFNKATIIVVVGLTVLFYIKGKVMLPIGDDSLREIMSLVFAFIFELVFLAILFVTRNFWVFKPPKR